MVKTINQIKKELEEIVKAHEDLNDFYFGNFLDAYSNKLIAHSCLIADITTVTPNNPKGTNSYVDITLMLTVADLVSEGKSQDSKKDNVLESKSDTLLLLLDVFNIFQSTRWRETSSIQSSAANYFEQRGGDLVNGWWMNVTLRMVTLRDICEIPLVDYDFNGVSVGTTDSGSPSTKYLTCLTLSECVVIATLNSNIEGIDEDLTTHIQDTSNPHGVTAAQVGAPTIAEAQAFSNTAESNAKAYADDLVVGLLDDRGSWDASGGIYPNSNGSGPAGSILKGDLYFISVAGNLGGEVVTIGDSVRALTDNPGQTASNWDIIQVNITYVPENVQNKDTDTTLSANSDTRYPSQKAVKTYIDNEIASVGSNGGMLFKTFTNQTVTGTLAETIMFSVLIPAGTIQTEDILRISVRAGGTSNAIVKNIRTYFNETNDLTTPMQVSNTQFTTGSRTFIQERHITIDDAATTQYVPSVAGNFQHDFDSVNSVPANLGLDFTNNDYYFIITGQVDNIAGIANLWSAWAEILR